MEKSSASVPAMLQVTAPMPPDTVGAKEVQGTFSGVEPPDRPSMTRTAVSMMSVTVTPIDHVPWFASESVTLAVTR